MRGMRDVGMGRDLRLVGALKGWEIGLADLKPREKVVALLASCPPPNHTNHLVPRNPTLVLLSIFGSSTLWLA
jgi:hypothetical protein